MKKTTLAVIFMLMLWPAFSQKGIWQNTNEKSTAGTEKVNRATTPVAYTLFSLNLEQLKQSLGTAPMRGASAESGIVIQFPDVKGALKSYRVFEAPVMQEELAAEHPDIKSYVGQGVDNPVATVRFSITMYGLHGMVLSQEGTTYIDPYTKDKLTYIIYRKADLVGKKDFTCFSSSLEDATQKTVVQQAPAANDRVLRKYRLAMACTAEYSAFHVTEAGVGNGTTAQKKAAVLAAMNVSMTRINGVYERELAVTMQLVNNNENIIFIGTDQFNNEDAEVLISQSQSVINSVIGSANYDIGHTVSTGAGGLALLGVICENQYKAQGVTGSDAPVGDPFDIDFVAHELGHQFGADHTFNGRAGSCNGNFNNSTSVEPGSGTTIMGYAGICGAANVQSNSDDYFNTVSLDEIFTVLRGTSCAQEQTLANTPPVVAALMAKTIPNGTAFVLKAGTVTDAENDALTYCWEQTNGVTNNAAHINVPVSTATQGPNFRSLPPTTSPERYFPRLSDVISGNLYPQWEVTSDVGRVLNFALTVRDNNPEGGQTARRNMNVTVSGTAGPFMVTSQVDENITWTAGTQQTVTWDVAGTTGNNINTANVNILLSTNAGQTFDTVLLANTPNDGSEAITVPNVMAPLCRIMVQPVDNVYYAVNAANFSIGYIVTSECNTFTNNSQVTIPDGTGNFVTSSVSVGQGASVASVNVGVNVTHSYVSDLTIKAVSPAGSEVILWDAQCGGNNNINATFSDAGATLSCGNPTQGTIRPVEALSAFTGENPQGTWQIAVADNAGGDTGHLNSWRMELCSYIFTPASADDFGLQNFRLYPNPSNGVFTVEFTSASQSPVNVSVYDMRGRVVYNSSFTNTGLVSGNINLQSAQKGVYLVNVQDGNRKETRKIVVN